MREIPTVSRCSPADRHLSRSIEWPPGHAVGRALEVLRWHRDGPNLTTTSKALVSWQIL